MLNTYFEKLEFDCGKFKYVEINVLIRNGKFSPETYCRRRPHRCVKQAFGYL